MDGFLQRLCEIPPFPKLLCGKEEQPGPLPVPTVNLALKDKELQKRNQTKVFFRKKKKKKSPKCFSAELAWLAEHQGWCWEEMPGLFTALGQPGRGEIVSCGEQP